MESCRKRERQQSMQDDDSDAEMAEIGSNSDFKEFGGKRMNIKGQVKQNHSEIEKRRRDKMNTYINELSSMIPMCNAMSRKLDKLTVLRMAVQHMRALRGGSKPVTESNYKPSFLSDEDLKNLVLESADGFLLVVGCDRGRILYVSDSVQKLLSQPQSDLVGQSFFDLVHPKDIATVKDQVSYLDNPNTDKSPDKNAPVIQSKTENKQVPKQMCSGARRSFICRLKCGLKGKKLKGNDESSDFYIMNRKAKLKSLAAIDKKKFVVVHFTGYLKSWPPSGVTMEEEDEDQDSKNLSCLIAVGREVAVADLDSKFDNQTFPTEFVSRHSIDGKFIYLDQRVLPICGYLPQEMIGTSAYDYFHPQDLYKIAETHKNTVITSDSYTVTYRFMCKAGHYIYLKSKSTNFRNPWTKELEFIICVNEIDLSKPNPIVPSNVPANISHQRPILPAQSVQGADGMTGDMDHSHKTVRKVIETLQEGEGPAVLKRARATSDDGSDPSVSTEAAQIGSIIAELSHEKISTHRSPHSMLGPQAPNPNFVHELSNQQRLNPGPSASNMTNTGQSTSSVGGPMLSMFPGVNNPVMPEMSQPHLVEQLIGMQQAIESMERPGMQQNEETMAMFMNMLEADAGLGGDLNDILFEGN